MYFNGVWYYLEIATVMKNVKATCVKWIFLKQQQPRNSAWTSKSLSCQIAKPSSSLSVSAVFSSQTQVTLDETNLHEVHQNWMNQTRTSGPHSLSTMSDTTVIGSFQYYIHFDWNFPIWCALWLVLSVCDVNFDWFFSSQTCGHSSDMLTLFSRDITFVSRRQAC